MKRTVFLAIILFACFANLSAQEEAKSKMVFDTYVHDFGNVHESDGNVSCEFKFRNEGDAPLIITRVSSSCGCTTPKYPREPIAPNGNGVIDVTYQAKGRPGGFSKNITIYTNNADEKIKLIITGNVIPLI